MKKSLTLLLAFLIILVSGFLKYYRPKESLKHIQNQRKAMLGLSGTSPLQEYCRKIFPEADSYILSRTVPPFYYAIKYDSKSSKKIIGYILFTEDFAPNIKGYSSMIKMALGVNKDRILTKAFILSQEETPMYTASIDKYMQQFENKSISEIFSLGLNIDGITHATITSQAIIDSINKSLSVFSSLLSSESKKPITTATHTIPLSQIVIPLLLFLFAVLNLYIPSLHLRWKILFVSLLYLGFAKATFFSVIQIINITIGQYPPLINNLLSYAIIGLTLLSLMIWGNIYCGYICPFAAIEELLSKLFSKFTSSGKRINLSVVKKARIAKYIVLFVAVSTGILLGTSNVAIIEVFVLFFTRNASVVGWIFVGCIFLFSLFYHRFWCRFLCPIGAFNGLLSSLSYHKIRITQDTCNHCQNCVKICPMDALESQNKKIQVEHSQCILCGKCLSICPQKTIEYK